MIFLSKTFCLLSTPERTTRMKQFLSIITKNGVVRLPHFSDIDFKDIETFACFSFVNLRAFHLLTKPHFQLLRKLLFAIKVHKGNSCLSTVYSLSSFCFVFSQVQMYNNFLRCILPRSFSCMRQ
jgi:hypothetical protein